MCEQSGVRLKRCIQTLALVACSGFACSPAAEHEPLAPSPAAGLPVLSARRSQKPKTESPSVDPGAKLPDPRFFSDEAASIDLPRFAFQASCQTARCNLPEVLLDFGETQPIPNLSVYGYDLAASSSVSFGQRESHWLMAIVLCGKVEIHPANDSPARSANPWDVVYAPGAGLTLVAGPEPVRLLIAVGQREPSADAALLRVDSFARAAHAAWGNGHYHAFILHGAEEPDMPTSLSLLWATRDSAVPPNVHDTEWEHLAILDGRGTMLIGEQRIPLGPGDVYHVPPGIEHGFKSAGKTELVAVQWFTPPGPEQRYFSLPGR